MPTQPLDPRLAKFSFDPDERALVEAAIQLLILEDALTHRPDPKESTPRFAIFQQRCEKMGSLAFKHDATDKSASDDLYSVAGRLSRQVKSGFGSMSLLKTALAAVELQSATPYAGADGALAKYKIPAKTRAAVVRRIVHGTGYRAQWAAAVVDAEAAAVASYEWSWWTKALFASLGAVGAVVVAVFAAPAIGGLIGTYFLGLTGAAAVSAGLALLGGGAVAAGGFGMLGGTVLLGAAFGVAGAGGAAFLGKGGDQSARLFAIKTQAAFKVLLDMKLMDHELAADFLEGVKRQRDQYVSLSETKTGDEKTTATKVAKVLSTAYTWMSDQYGAATTAGWVLRKPRAWAKPAASPKSDVADADFSALLDQLSARLAILESCARFLSNAHRTVAEVKDANYLRTVRDLITRRSKKRLMYADAMLSEVLLDVLALVAAQQEEAATLARAIKKAQALQEAVQAKDDIILRHQRIAIKLYAQVTRLTSENEALKGSPAEHRCSFDGPTSEQFGIPDPSLPTLASVEPVQEDNETKFVATSLESTFHSLEQCLGRHFLALEPQKIGSTAPKERRDESSRILSEAGVFSVPQHSFREDRVEGSLNSRCQFAELWTRLQRLGQSDHDFHIDVIRPQRSDTAACPTFEFCASDISKVEERALELLGFIHEIAPFSGCRTEMLSRF